MADLTSYSPTVYSSNTDQFGSVLHGNNDMGKLMVTAPESDNKGKVFIYNYSGGNFTFYSLITAAPFANRSAGDGFGTSLALSAVFGTDMYFVGMPGKSRVYVYENPGTPTASQTYVLSASDSNANVRDFGSALALSGRHLVVGCARNSETVANGGACYYFSLTGGIAKYAQLQRFTSSDLLAGDRFGFSVATFENRLVVGAPMKTFGASASAGAVYYFTFNPTTSAWTQQQKIDPPVPQTEGFFGASLDINQNGLVIGSNSDASGVTQGGAAYYYTLAGSTYTLANTFTGYLENFTASSSVRQQTYALGVALSSAGSNTSVVAGAPTMVCFDYPDGLAVFKNGGISINNIGAPAPLSLRTFRNTLSTTAIYLGASVTAEFPGIVVAGAPESVAAIPGAFFKLGSPYVGDNYVKTVMGTPPNRAAFTGQALSPSILLANFITNNIPATAFSATGLPTGATLNTATGEIAGTITAGVGSYTVTPASINIGGTSTGGNFDIVVNTGAGDYTLGTAGAGSVAIGDQAGSGNSINSLLRQNFGTSNSSLSAREDQASNPYRTAMGSGSNPFNKTGVCNPYQTDKAAANWAPTGTNNTYLPARMSEFRGAYRWAASLTNPITWSCNPNPPGPGNGQLTVTGNGSPGGAPYYFALVAGAVASTPQNPTGGAGFWVTTGGSSYTFTGLGTGTKAIYVKDAQGCGLIGQIAYAAQVTYPYSSSG
jgi:hypothetical protein